MADHLSGCWLPYTCVHCQCHRSSRRIEVDVTSFARSDGTSTPKVRTSSFGLVLTPNNPGSSILKV
eukprot:693201-Prymnesium_polylepis.1